MEKANRLQFSIVLSTRSQKEIAASWEWYEDRSQGLGDRFVEEVKARLHEIEKAPYNYSARYKEYRETSINSFPYQIVFRVNKKKKSIRILSVFHTSRSTKKKYP